MDNPKDAELFKHIDATLSEETTLHDGLVWAVSHGWMTEQDAEHLEKTFHEENDLPG